jgi:hypothetical protein
MTSNLLFIDDVVSFVLRYPDHKHYIGTSTIDQRIQLEDKFILLKKRVGRFAGAAFTPLNLNLIDTDQLDVFISSTAQLISGWNTPSPKRCISFIEPLPYEYFVQAGYRLLGEDSRIGFAAKENPIFQDIPIQLISGPSAQAYGRQLRVGGVHV